MGPSARRSTVVLRPTRCFEDRAVLERNTNCPDRRGTPESGATPTAAVPARRPESTPGVAERASFKRRNPMCPHRGQEDENRASSERRGRDSDAVQVSGAATESHVGRPRRHGLRRPARRGAALRLGTSCSLPRALRALLRNTTLLSPALRSRPEPVASGDEVLRRGVSPTLSAPGRYLAIGAQQFARADAGRALRCGRCAPSTSRPTGTLLHWASATVGVDSTGSYSDPVPSAPYSSDTLGGPGRGLRRSATPRNPSASRRLEA